MKRLACLPLSLLPFVAALGCGQAKPEPPPPKPPVVKVCRPKTDAQVTDYEDFTGRTEAYRYVEVRARVTGYLQQIHFEDGATVEKGQVLFTIEPKTYKAAFEQAEANLRQAVTRLNTMELNLKRARDLRQRNAISQEDFDKAVGDRDEADAAVGVARANKNTAKINLDYCRVIAPVTGRVSRRMVDVGNTVKADDTMLTTVVRQDPMYVTFYMDERTFLRIRRLIKKGDMPEGRYNVAPVEVGLADQPGHELKGQIDFEDNLLDAGTGTYRVRAVLDNKDGFLSPGLFARVRLYVGRKHPATLVPEQALGTDQGQKFIFVVKPKIDPKTKKAVTMRAKVETPEGKKVEKELRIGVVESRRVKVGRVHRVEVAKGVYKDLREIAEGELAKDEWVIVRGLQRVRDKVEALMDETTVVEFDADPASGGQGSPKAAGAEPRKPERGAGERQKLNLPKKPERRP
jgi:RND family efflux transporter MFP subunit